MTTQPWLKALMATLLFSVLSMTLLAQEIQKETHTFAITNGDTLRLDRYSKPTHSSELKPCLMFMFGGGFITGSRDSERYLPYFRHFAEKGFEVVSIDYRLGMKGQKAPSVFNTKPLQHSIRIAVEDLFSATQYVLSNAQTWNIDTTRIIVSGSSAGAISVLQADYELRNRREIAHVLSPSFRYAGVISFAGAIFSTQGIPTYANAPAPTLFFHGSNDKLVPYHQIKFLKLGFFGSKALAKQFYKQGYPYQFYSMDGMSHEVAEYPMIEFQDEIDYFIQHFVFDRRQWMVDISVKDKLRKSDLNLTPDNLY